MTKRKIKSRKIAFLVPAYNEETVIVSTIRYLLKVAPKKDIFIIDDGSKDNTAKVAKKYISNVLTIKNGGKANAITTGIEKFNLIKKYSYIMPVDADTILSPNLPRVVEKAFKDDKNKKVVAVVCKVVGRDTSLTTSYRMWEYEISQAIYKSAQSVINSITVNPGCSTVYRTDLFNKIKFPSRTMTEDMDMTFMIHRKKLGRIIYTPKAIVITQDPKTIKEFLKQIDRWYTGFWQCVLNHKVPWGGQIIDAELTLLGLDGVFNGFLSVFLVLTIPILLVQNPAVVYYPFLFDLLLFVLPTLAYTAIMHKTAKLFIYIPFFYFLRIASGIVFLKSFFKVVVGVEDKNGFVWDTARYVPREESAWANQTS
jgi:poly-beta-1,6-N-acetyl-D-glucosamine synthase